jgi:hydroxymethylglutaryl-CoA reductase (NADPH)
MPTNYEQAKKLLENLIQSNSKQTLKDKLSPKPEKATRPAVGNEFSSYQKRWEQLKLSPQARAELESVAPQKEIEVFQKNIENYIGTVKIPLGLAGPLRVNGLHANGDYLIPLATTEAALVASYNRGTKVISESGGCTSVLVNAYVSRTPCFAFRNISEVGEFLLWVNENFPKIKEKAEATTRHGKLVDFKFTIEGNRIFMSFDYHTGDASGQNMVTIATQAAYDYIRAQSPIKAEYSYVEANMSGDKKAALQSFQNTRGRKVVSEVVIPQGIVEKQLHLTVDDMVRFFATTSVGGILSGNIGIQGHYANALAALYIACGQDAACVAESAVGITRFEKTKTGDLYASVTLPNLMIGTVGGGTGLPSQKACLEILGLSGSGNANALAEVAAGLCLAGELSISAAMASDTFTRAHQLMARVGTFFKK